MTPRSKEKELVRVKCGWWERDYTFAVDGERAVCTFCMDEPGMVPQKQRVTVSYDTETLKANAREKGGYWKPLSQGRERKSNG